MSLQALVQKWNIFQIIFGLWVFSTNQWFFLRVLFSFIFLRDSFFHLNENRFCLLSSPPFLYWFISVEFHSIAIMIFFFFSFLSSCYTSTSWAFSNFSLYLNRFLVFQVNFFFRRSCCLFFLCSFLYFLSLLFNGFRFPFSPFVFLASLSFFLINISSFSKKLIFLLIQSPSVSFFFLFVLMFCAPFRISFCFLHFNFSFFP